MERKEAKKERENDCNSILGTTSIKECVTINGKLIVRGTYRWYCTFDVFFTTEKLKFKILLKFEIRLCLIRR